MDETKQFTNRELYMLIDKNNELNKLQHEALLQSIQNFHETTGTTLGSILTQTQRTNGRVTKLEGWRSYTAGGIAFFCLIGLPILWSLYNDLKKDDQLLTQHLAQTK
jgi:hypothetical protein